MSDDYVQPCARPENDPDDWFIEKDGRQYVDEPVLTDQEIVDLEEGFEPASVSEAASARLSDAHQEAIDAKLAENLVKRRHAKDKCFTECYSRTKCLGLALGPNAPSHGTFGGYYPEELRQIRDLRDERQRQRDEASHDADVPTSE